MRAVKLGQPDLVPINGSWDPVPARKIVGRGVAKSLDPRKDLNRIVFEDQRIMNEASKKLGFDALDVDVGSIYPRDYRPRFIDSETYIDHFNIVWKIREDVKTTFWTDGLIRNLEELDNFTFPNPDEMCYDIIDLTVEDAADDYAVVVWFQLCESISWMMRGGIDKMVQDIYRNPDFAKKLIDKVANANFEIAKRVMDRGVDVMVWAGDIADSKSPYFPLRIFEEFYFPHARKLVDECRKRDIPLFKHSDGNLYPILDALVSLGINGLHPIEPGIMDLADVKKRYGDKICLMGNVDCVHTLPYGSEEDVRRDVRRCVDAAAKGGGFILSDSNSLHNNVEVENVWTMVDEARKYGVYDAEMVR
jgi:uroporphyrinogen decarboxylase